MPIKVLDLFAGPGGLGEGFAAYRHGETFEIALSAEMESSAHSTLTLRSFFRNAKLAGDKLALAAYYEYCHTGFVRSKSNSALKLWAKARNEAHQLTLGDPKSNAIFDAHLTQHKLDPDKTVLIGGPPCQAYSLVGRARNRGKRDYVPEADHRHFLYQEYLRILGKTRPAIFVMENVKGILSSRVGSHRIFSDILTDLSNPAVALAGIHGGAKYSIYSLSGGAVFAPGMDPAEVDATKFIVRSEAFGIPQARHRVILLGVRSDVPFTDFPGLAPSAATTVQDAIGGLPTLRSRLSSKDSLDAWATAIREFGQSLASSAIGSQRGVLESALRKAARELQIGAPSGGLRIPKLGATQPKTRFERWISDPMLFTWLNHEARSHMKSDLARYLYSAVFAEHYGRSPKGPNDFDLPGLAPTHKNWHSGKFADRFRVQRRNEPATTITSHIAKDGHYFIHPDPTQCRSLTVREAARLQTFPDNYFFQGTRTQQYHQVGNAVPPLLALQIAECVDQIMRQSGAQTRKVA